MFSNLSKGSVLYGLDTKKGIKVFTGIIDTMTMPYPKNIQNAFGQMPEMVVDITATVDGERKEFKQIPSINTIADFGDGVFVLSDSKDSLSGYLRTQRQKSQNIVDSYTRHKELIPQYDRALQDLHPEMVNDSVVKELKEQVGTLQSQLAEALALLKSGNAKQEEKKI